MQAIESLLEAVSDDHSCGPYLDDDIALYGQFNQLEQLAAGKPEQVMGDQVIPAEEPEWSAVEDLACELLTKTKDLRIAVYLTRAWLSRHSYKGLAQGTKLIRQLLESYWADVHPQLVIDDDDDPFYRLNALAELGSAISQDLLAKAILVESRAIGRFSLRDIRIARGDIKPVGDDTESISESHVQAAFESADPELIQSIQGYIQQISGDLQTIVSLFEDKLSGQAPDISAFRKEVDAVAAIYTQYAGNSSETEQVTGGGAWGGSESSSEANDMSKPAATPVPGRPGEVNSRADVLVQIDKICEFYARHEPSSPVPLLLKRAKKLVEKDFMEILQDMAPDGIAQALLLVGKKEEPVQDSFAQAEPAAPSNNSSNNSSSSSDW